MTKRARFNGQYPVSVAVDTADTQTEFVTVVPGGLLPLETESGAPVPASVRDDLIKNNDLFSEVDQADQSKKADDKSDSKKDDA